MQNYCIYNTKLRLIRPECIFNGTLCCLYLGSLTNYQAFIESLHPNERTHYHTLRFERRIKSYLLGRFVAKNAVSNLIDEPILSNIQIQSGIFTQPLVVSSFGNIQVSITHSDDMGAALAYPEAHPMGIDLEKIVPENTEVLERPTSDTERELLRNGLMIPYETFLTLLWTAKEALSKVLKTGFMVPLEILAISKIEPRDNYTLCYYKNFSQYKAYAFLVGEYMCSIVSPLKTELQFDIQSLQKCFIASHQDGGS